MFIKTFTKYRSETSKNCLDFLYLLVVRTIFVISVFDGLSHLHLQKNLSESF